MTDYASVYVINVPIHSISGTHSISEDDIGLPTGTLPPDDLATMGHLIVVDKKLLAPIGKLRAQTKRLLASKGVKAGMGTVVTAADLPALIKDLELIKTEFYSAKSDLLTSFDSELQKRINEHPEYASLIERYAPDIRYIERRLSYDIDTYRFEVRADDPHADILSTTLQRDGNDITSNLLREIATFVDQAYVTSIQNSGRISKANLVSLNRTLLPKIKSFQLLNRSLVTVGDHLERLIKDIDAFISARPKGAAFIDGVDLQPFEKRLNQLRSPESIRSLMSSTSVVDNSLGTPARPPVVQPELVAQSAPVSLPKRPPKELSRNDDTAPKRKVVNF